MIFYLSNQLFINSIVKSDHKYYGVNAKTVKLLLHPGFAFSLIPGSSNTHSHR